jgi:hypothetical protein
VENKDICDSAPLIEVFTCKISFQRRDNSTGTPIIIQLGVGGHITIWQHLHNMSQPYFEGVWGWNSHSRNGDLGVLWDPRNFNCRGQNTLHWGVHYIIGKLSKCRCRKWVRRGHLDIYSTRYGKKKELGIKLAVWLLTIKSWELTRPWCMQVECDTMLERPQGELQVCFKPHPNRRFGQRVMTLQSPGSPNRDNFGTPPWESRDKKPIGCGCCGEA